jgi:hypothetical protein
VDFPRSELSLVDPEKNSTFDIEPVAAELGVSEGSLLDAVDAVGNQARAVEFHLRLGKPRERRKTRRSADVPSTIEL